MSSTPDHVYLDLSTVNNDILGTDNRPLNFTESRTNPIIDNPSNYYMSVIRFEVDTPASSLPIFIPKLLIDGENRDKNKTAYSITMARPNLETGLLDDVVKRYVEWSPQEKIASLPNNQFSNTGIPSATLPATVFDANALPYPTSTVVLTTTQNDTDKPTYIYTGSPVTALSSFTQILSSQAKFVWTDPQPAGLTCSFTVGTFQSSLPILAGFSAGSMPIVMDYHIGAGDTENVSLVVTAVTEIVTPSSVGNVFSYLVVANVSAIVEPLGPDVVVEKIIITNNSLSQLQGSVPRILRSTFLSATVVNDEPVYNFQLQMDKNYFDLPPVPSTNTSVDTLTATIQLSRDNDPKPLGSSNYSILGWSGLTTPVATADLAANYTYSSAPTINYSMILNDSEGSSVRINYSPDIDFANLLYVYLLTDDPVPNTYDVNFLIGTEISVASENEPENIIVATIKNATLVPTISTLVNPPGLDGTYNAYQIVLEFADAISELGFQSLAPVSTLTFYGIELTAATNSRIVFPPVPPTNPTNITGPLSEVFINDSVLSELTFFGTTYSVVQSLGKNQPIFSLGFNATFTPIAEFPTTVQYSSVAMSVKPIAPTLSTQDITTGYYNCYNVKWWLNCVNKTLADLWNDIGGLENYSPQMVVDSNSNLITLMTPYNTDAQQDPSNFAVSDNVASTASYLGTGSEPAVNYSMFFNEPMYNLFSSLSSIHYGSTTIGNAQLSAGSQAVVAGNFSIFAYYVQAINFNFKNYIETNSSLITVPQHWFLTESEYSPVPMWSPVSSLIFSTSLLPVQMSLTTTPNVFGNNIYDKTFVGGSIGNNSQITTMISDIQVPLTTGSEYKPTVLYAPGAEYRLIDLLGNTPINQASFSIAYKTKFGDIIPFSLGSLCGANLKILFRRKRFNLGNVAPFDTN